MSQSKKLVIVESPTKARTIRKFLKADYIVESCMGHIRDLPESAKDIPAQYKKYKWSKLGVNVDDQFKPIYCIPPSKQKIIMELKKKAKNLKEIILATDEDREGESISWHLQEILKTKKISFKRMVFHEITKSAILESLKNFRKINMDLVYAQEARRILDRLVGYTISPVLWKNIARGLSAGRVQSVAVRLLSEQELKRMDFKKSNYWSLTAHLSKNKTSFEAQLSSYKGQNLVSSGDFDRETGRLLKTKFLLLDEKKAHQLVKNLKNSAYKVLDVKTQSISKKPQAPFTTSTLQQSANRRLSLSSKETMSLAQQLYERGFITYMRTDAVFLSKQAVHASRKAIEKIYGKKYLPDKPRVYKNKSKGAQEAHEAIRPAGQTFVHPKDTKLKGSLFNLYQMIWQRTLASQAVDCQQKRVSTQIAGGNQAVFSASGMTIVFDGYYKIYGHKGEEKCLPALKAGDVLKCMKLSCREHETKPPARFTEASLVQILEKEGIGRPSTYAPIIATIQKRGYAFKDKNALIPTMTALIVTRFLKSHFPDYVDSAFTSDMEEVLDQIAVGKENHIQYLDKIYFGKQGLSRQIQKQEKNSNGETRILKFKNIAGFTFYAGPYGAYVVRDSKKKEKQSISLPPHIYPGDLTKEDVMDLFDKKLKGNESIGKDPQTGEPVYVLVGRYGPYVQRGELKEGKKDSVKRVSIPKGLPSEEVDLSTALKLLKLPQVLGAHPDTKKDIKKGIGRFGPYIVHDGDYRSIRSVDEFLNLTQKQALDILSKPKKQSKKVVKDLGLHPSSKNGIRLLNGKYGFYIQHGRQKISLPKGMSASRLKLKQAIELLDNNEVSKNAKNPVSSKNIILKKSKNSPNYGALK